MKGTFSSPKIDPLQASTMSETSSSASSTNSSSSTITSKAPSLVSHKKVSEEEIEFPIQAIVVDTPEKLYEALSQISQAEIISIAMKSKDLGPKGINSILCISPVNQANDVFLIDLKTLGDKAFALGRKGGSLKAILQSLSVKKLAFDVRNISAALFHCYKINLRNALDVQLVELATRPAAKRRLLAGFNKAMESSEALSSQDEREFKAAREQFVAHFVPNKGGGGDDQRLFERPINQILEVHCIMDTYYLPALYEKFLARLGSEPQEWLDRISEETVLRVKTSRAKNYTGQGKLFKFGPFSWNTI